MSLEVDKVYMIHYTPLKERKQRLLESIPFDMQWIESEPKHQYWNTDKKNWEEKVIPHIPYRQLKESEISLAHKIIEALKDIVKNGYKRSLIFEDDVILIEDFVNTFNANLSATAQDWDFIFIGSGCNLRVPRNRLVEGQVAYKVPHPATKCTDSFCVTLEAAKKVLDTIIPFTFPIDFELNYQLALHDMNVYWWEPPIVQQGSQCGLHRSAIQS